MRLISAERRKDPEARAAALGFVNFNCILSSIAFGFLCFSLNVDDGLKTLEDDSWFYDLDVNVNEKIQGLKVDNESPFY